MTTAYFSLGSNVEPEENLRLAVRELERRCGPLALSPVYRNQAVGFVGPEFLNLVARCDTELPLSALITAVHAVHELAGRQRGTERFADRTLDVDVLMYGRLTGRHEDLELPRSDVLDYAFVLKPLADLAPDDTHPCTGLSFGEHWAAFAGPSGDLRRVELRFA